MGDAGDSALPEDGPVVGLFGLSGVGKTRYAKEVVAREPRVLHLQASELLRRASGLDDEELRTARRDRLVANQGALAAALHEARAGRRDRPVLIDAHSVIDNDVELVDVPFEAIDPLRINAFVFLHAAPELIVARRSRSDRLRPFRSAETLAEHQRRALHACREYAARSGASLTIVEAVDGPVDASAAICALSRPAAPVHP